MPLSAVFREIYYFIKSARKTRQYVLILTSFSETSRQKCQRQSDSKTVFLFYLDQANV